VCAFVGYGLATQGWMIYAIIVFGSLGAVSQPAAQSLITQTVHADEQGATQGALTSLQSIAGIFGPIIGGTVFGYFISDRATWHVPGAPFFTGAMLAAAGWVAAAWAVSRPSAPRAAGRGSARSGTRA
jgi:DHA1 family tetracycline resistance protein-like MFS transporter